VLDKSRSVVRFVHYALMHIKFGTFVSTTALPSLNGAVLARISLRLPNLEEQTAIATVLSDLDADLSALESRLAKTRAIKQGMMQELLTGRTRLI
jgi:type I restriction enzyme S subunit